jgi:hypothetical protein
MQAEQGKRLHSLQTVDAFLTKHAERLPTVAGSGARRKLDEILAELSTYVSDQSASALATQGATQKLHALRRALICDHLAPISTMAGMLFGDTPEIAPFRLPRGSPPVQQLAAAAYGTAEAAAPHAQLFISAGGTADFIDELTRAADAMVEADNERSQWNGKRRGATKGLRTTLAAGRRIVDVLNSLVKRALKDDPALLEHWHAVRQVRRVTARSARDVVPAVVDVPQVEMTPLLLLLAHTSIVLDERALPAPDLVTSLFGLGSRSRDEVLRPTDDSQGTATEVRDSADR